MPIRLTWSGSSLIGICLVLACHKGASETLRPLCHPSLTKPIIVDTHDQVDAGGMRTEPPLTNTMGFGFAWPDTQMGVIKTERGYKFFTSDGAYHPITTWEGKKVGNNNYGSVTATEGTLDNPLGTGVVHDVTISPNPDPGVNPNYPSYTYIGGGPVFQVPPGILRMLPGTPVPPAVQGQDTLLVGYHAELPNDALYAVHGLAASSDGGLHWTDLGEVVRTNQAYEQGLDGLELGDGPLVLSPDKKYFYFYFPDWIANGTVHTTNANGVATTTNVSVARAPVLSVLEAAFGTRPQHMAPFEKYYQGSWKLQPGIGGASTDLIPDTTYGGYLDVHYNDYLHRYVMITSDDEHFAYAESIDGIHWTDLSLIATYGIIAAYPTSVGLGDDPSILGKSFYVYFTHLQPEDGGLPREGNSVDRFTVTCQ